MQKGGQILCRFIHLELLLNLLSYVYTDFNTKHGNLLHMSTRVDIRVVSTRNRPISVHYKALHFSCLFCFFKNKYTINSKSDAIPKEFFHLGTHLCFQQRHTRPLSIRSIGYRCFLSYSM